MNIITNLAWSSIKKDKSRSILTTISICLTALLLSTIATFGYGIIKFNRSNAGQLYGSFYGSYQSVNEEGLRQMQLRSEFTDIGKLAILGNVESNKNLYLCQADDMVLSMVNMDKKIKEGYYPVKRNEIAAQPEFFKLLGVINPKIGGTVTISYRTNLDEAFKPDTFIISGLLEETNKEQKSNNYSAYVSEDYYKQNVTAKNRSYMVYFRLDKSLGINSDNGEEIMKDLAVKCGIDDRFVSDNYSYLMWSLDPGTETIIVCIMISIIVILFSVMVIYNIFHVGIVQKVQEYGKLKAIGSTRKQMKKIVFREGMLLAIIGIPIGVLTGYITAVFSFEWIMKLFDKQTEVSGMNSVYLFSLPILLLAALLTFLTVWAALKKPMKIVSSISPVEAMRYQEFIGSEKGIRKGRKSLNVTGMTMANLSAHRKRTASTILTMGLSCVLYIIIANFLGNMDTEYNARRSVEHGQFRINLSYSMHDTAYPENNLNNILENNPLNEELIEKIKGFDGVTDVTTRNILYAEPVDEAGNKTGEAVSITVYSRQDFENELVSGVLGSFNYDQVSKENGIIFSWSNFIGDYGYHIDQEVNFMLFNGMMQKIYSTQIMGSFGSANGNFVITEDTFNNLGLNGNMTYIIWVDCKNSDVQMVKKSLDELLLGNEHVEMILYQDALSNSKASMLMMKTGGYLLCFLIAFISFMNMANTIITSITTRKQEFGVLQAIGMTNKQLNRSLQMEGIFFTFGTVLVSMVLGIPAGYMIFSYGKSNGWIGLHVYHFPVVEITLMVIVLAIMQIMLSFILTRNIKKESLVERIRYQK